MRHTIDVGVDSKSGFPEGHALNNVGGLTTHTRQIQQQVHIRGHLASMLLNQSPRHLHQMIGLRVGVGDTADILQYVFWLRLRHRLGIGIVTEQFRRHLIDSLVGALGTENDGHEQLEHAAKLEFCIHVGHLFTEMRQDSLISLFFLHSLQSYEKNPN